MSWSDPLTQQTSYVYDAEGNNTSVADPLSHATTAVYDSLDRQTSVTDPLNNTSTASYDAASQVTAQADPLNNQTSIVYTARAQLASLSTPVGGGYANGYTSQGWLNAQTASGGGTTNYSFNSVGWKTAITDPLNQTTNLGYNDGGFLTSSTNPLGKVTSFAYNSRGEVTGVTDPLNHTTSYGYDHAGNVTSVTDALNRVTGYQYDAQNRVTQITNAANAATKLAYDLAGRPSTVTDADNNVTTLGYDAANRLTSQTDALNHATNSVYDAAGRLTSVTDRDGRTIAYNYDNANRVTAENWLNGLGQSIYTITYGYDNAGRLTSVADPDATYALAYDGGGRLSSINNAGTPGVPQMTLSYTYDLHDNVTQLADNLGGSIAYTYDTNNRITSEQLGVTGVNAAANVIFAYDSANRLTNISRTNPLGGGSGGSGGSGGGSVAVNSSFTYDDANRLTGITHSAGATNLASYTLGYDSANQLTSETSNDGTENYGYDAAGQLTSATGWRSESYSYDATGNRTMAGYSTGTGNRLVSDGNFNYTYDADGNLLTKTEIATGNVTTYTWDYRNRLTSVVVKDSNNNVIQQSNYTYDPFDRRIGTSFDPDGAGPQPAVQTKTVWDGLNPFADFNGAGALTNRYLERAAAVDQVMASFSATGVIGWHLADQLGSVRDIADQNGNVQDHVKYDSFGKVLSESNPANGDRFKFTGRELDGTGDYNYRARYYNPATGRFTSEDPTGLAAGDPNVFRYTANAPTAATDPTGTADQPAGPWTQYGMTAEQWTQYEQSMVAQFAQAAAQRSGGTGSPAAPSPPSTGQSLWSNYGYYFRQGPLGWTVNGPVAIAQQVQEEVSAVHAGNYVQAIRSHVGFAWGAGSSSIVLQSQPGMSQLLGGLAALADSRAAGRGVTAAPIFDTISAGVAGGLDGIAARSIPANVRVFRVEGAPNTRIIIGEGGQVTIQGEQPLFLNFGNQGRAEAFLAKRLSQGMPGATVKSFEVPQPVLEELRASAVLETEVPQFPNSPIRVDVTKAPDQFGLRPDQIRTLQPRIIQGSGKTGL